MRSLTPSPHFINCHAYLRRMLILLSHLPSSNWISLSKMSCGDASSSPWLLILITLVWFTIFNVTTTFTNICAYGRRIIGFFSRLYVSPSAGLCSLASAGAFVSWDARATDIFRGETRNGGSDRYYSLSKQRSLSLRRLYFWCRES